MSTVPVLHPSSVSSLALGMPATIASNMTQRRQGPTGKLRSIHIRNIPEDLLLWIKRQATAQGKSQNDLLLELLAFSQSPDFTGFLFSPERLIAPIHPEAVPFTFIDLFAGIGGFRIGLEAAGGKCIFTSEWDVHAQRTYFAWFGEMPHGDIRAIPPEHIPSHDVLAAGFPCQPFSIAGVSKKQSLGRKHGFLDETQGTLFYDIAEILRVKKTPVVLLENVKNLLAHDRGRTWQVIKGTLEELGYVVFHQIIDAAAYVPQHRERVFIVGFRRNIFGPDPEFRFPQPPGNQNRAFRDILELDPDPKYTLSDHLWSYLQEYARRHQERGNGFGFGLTSLDGRARTLSARYHKDGSEILIPQQGKNPRRLTPREAGRLMGYPEALLDKIVVSDTQAYRQFGNSLCPLIAEAVALQIAKVMRAHVLGATLLAAQQENSKPEEVVHAGSGIENSRRSTGSRKRDTSLPVRK